MVEGRVGVSVIGSAGYSAGQLIGVALLVVIVALVIRDGLRRRYGDLKIDVKEARALASASLEPFRSKSFAELLDLLGRSRWESATGGTGTEYAIKIYAFWDDYERRVLRVVAAAETGTKNSFGFVRQIAADFTMDPSGEIHGSTPSPDAG